MSQFQLGIDRLLTDQDLQKELAGRRVALLGHPASVTLDLRHSIDVLMATEIPITALFGPQHGMRGDKQDNMMESADEIDPTYDIPVFSLYGKTRRLNEHMLQQFDVLLVDLQDVGCRIYTFLTTLFYLIEDCAPAGKTLIVLDRPNPVGRPVEGLALRPGNESFVGAAAMPMRHGLTLGEAALWFRDHRGLDIDLRVVSMLGYAPDQPPGFGWPQSMVWVNPSPNLATLNAARVYSGSVLLEGTTLSEGRGTTRPLECVGAPDLPVQEILNVMRELAPQWLAGCVLRPCFFEPTFHKHAGQRCAGLHIHADHHTYDHEKFKPFRLILLLLKAIRYLEPYYELWRDFEYEYETGRLPIDVINGSAILREWVDDPAATVADIEDQMGNDEIKWKNESARYRLY